MVILGAAAADGVGCGASALVVSAPPRIATTTATADPMARIARRLGCAGRPLHVPVLVIAEPSSYPVGFVAAPVPAQRTSGHPTMQAMRVSPLPDANRPPVSVLSP